MREDAAQMQSSAYRDVGLAQADATQRANEEKETVAKRDERRARQMQGEARRWAKAMQADIDKATEAFKSGQVPSGSSWWQFWKDKTRPPTDDEVKEFRKSYAASLEKSNAPAIRGYKGMVKIDVESGTFEFIGDDQAADAWEVEDAAERGDAVPGSPKYDKDTGEPKPEDPATPKPKFVIIGAPGNKDTTYWRIDPDGTQVKIPRSQYFKGIGKPDPQNVSRKGESGPTPGGAAAEIMGQPAGITAPPNAPAGAVAPQAAIDPALSGVMGLPVAGALAGPLAIPPLISAGADGVANAISSVGPVARAAGSTASALARGAGATVKDWAAKTWESIASAALNRPTSEDVVTMRQIMADPAAAQRLVEAYPKMPDHQKRRVLLTVEAAKAP